jgi:hypothetical protein
MQTLFIGHKKEKIVNTQTLKLALDSVFFDELQVEATCPLQTKKLMDD